MHTQIAHVRMHAAMRSHIDRGWDQMEGKIHHRLLEKVNNKRITVKKKKQRKTLAVLGDNPDVYFSYSL